MKRLIRIRLWWLRRSERRLMEDEAFFNDRLDEVRGEPNQLLIGSIRSVAFALADVREKISKLEAKLNPTTHIP